MGGSGKQEGGSAVGSGSNNPSDNLHNSDSGSANQKKKGKGKAAAAALALKKALDNKANQNNPNHPSYYASRGKNAQKKEKRKNRAVEFKRMNQPDRVVDLRKKQPTPFSKPKFPKKIATSAEAVANFSGSTKQRALSLRKRIHAKLKHPFQLVPRVVKVRESLERAYYSPNKPIRAQIMEKRRKALGVALDSVNKLEFSLKKKVDQMGRRKKMPRGEMVRNFRSNMTKNQLLDGIVRDLEQDKIFENKVAYMYLCAVLNPERFKNIGIPDQYNGARSGKPTIVTEYIVPFDADNEAALVISDDPLQHITVLKGGSASMSIKGPIWQNVNETTGAANEWSGITGTLATSCKTEGSPVVSGSSATWKVTAGASGKLPLWFEEDTDTPVPLENIKIDGKSYDYLPLNAGDTFSITFKTADITTNGYTATLVTILDSGAIGGEGPTNLTGGAVTTGVGFITFTLSAGTVGVYSYKISNTLAGTDATPNLYVVPAASKALGQIVLPCGKANGDDVNFLIDYCSEYRSGPCSVKTTYYGGYLENGFLIQGQLPKDDDFILPPPTVQNWGLIPGVISKGLNDNAEGAYTAMIRRDVTSAQWEDLTDESGDNAPSHEQVIVFIKANSADAEFVRIRTALQFQYHTEVQSVYTDEGVVDEEAIDLAINWLMDKFDGMSPTFGNDDHEDKCEQALREFEKNRGGTTISFFNGWFSGNETSLSNDGEIIA